MNVRHPNYLQRHQRGFSLVEILVGIAIGMVGLLVIFKTVSIWDSHTRTTVAGGDAQVAGTLAMFNLERDIKLAGMGFGEAPAPVMGCSVVGTVNFPLYPVQIIPGVPAGASDSIKVLAGNSSFFVSGQPFTSSSATTKTVNAIGRAGFRRGDLVVVAGNETALPASATCALVQITDNVEGAPIVHAAGSYVPDPAYSAASSAASVFNSSTGTGSTFTSGTMYNLGPSPQSNLWQVTNGRVLSRTDAIHATAAFEVAEGVISVKAQYGVDANGDNIIADSEWVTTTPTDWTLVRAIRVALLVRSSQFEKPASTSAAAAIAVTTTAPSWFGGSFLMTNVDGTPDSETTDVPNNWRYYRYTVYEKVIPLRNMIWGTAP